MAPQQEDGQNRGWDGDIGALPPFSHPIPSTRAPWSRDEPVPARLWGRSQPPPALPAPPCALLQAGWQCGWQEGHSGQTAILAVGSTPTGRAVQ